MLAVQVEAQSGSNSDAACTRRATIDDLDAVVPLFDAYRIFYGQVPDPALARSFLHDRLAGGESVIFLAEAGDRALGFAQLYPSFSSARARRIFILNDLFVTERARGRGIGNALLEAAADFAQSEGAARLTLSTAHDNHSAQSVYRAAGWKQDETFLVFNLALD